MIIGGALDFLQVSFIALYYVMMNFVLVHSEDRMFFQLMSIYLARSLGTFFDMVVITTFIGNPLRLFEVLADPKRLNIKSSSSTLRSKSSKSSVVRL